MGKLSTEQDGGAVCQGMRAVELWFGLEPTHSGLNEEEDWEKDAQEVGTASTKILRWEHGQGMEE